MVDQLVGDAPKEPPPSQMPIGQSNQQMDGTSVESLPLTSAGTAGDDAAAVERSQPQPVAQVNDDAAAQREGRDVPAGTPSSARHKHGGAIPR